MKRSILFFLCVFACCMALFAADEPQSADAAQNRVFFVSRNLNRNIIVYDIQQKNGVLNQKEPLHVYWYNIEHNPITTNELNFIQRRLAYGYTVVEKGNNEVTVKLKAYKKRLLRVCKRGGKWVGITTINGKECVLTEIYAHCPTKTSCDYMELRGVSVASGKVEKETVKY